jgi:hypothetical protein
MWPKIDVAQMILIVTLVKDFWIEVISIPAATAASPSAAVIWGAGAQASDPAGPPGPLGPHQPRDLLRDAGNQVTSASNGASGLRLVASGLRLVTQRRPDLILVGPELAEIS